jgi:hypothetical protein
MTPTSSIQLFGGETLLAGANIDFTIDLERFNLEGFFSLQVEVSTVGGGTLTAEYLLSNNGTDFIEPSDAEDIFTDFGAADGPGADGKDINDFNPMLARYLRLKFTESSSANPVTFSAWLAIQ